MAIPRPAPKSLNLGIHRSEESNIWNRRGWDGSKDPIAWWRLLLAVSGGVLTLRGIRNRTWISLTLAGVGAGLGYWALAGKGDIDAMRARLAELAERGPWSGRQLDEAVHEASAESFPASDAPSWTPTVGPRA